MSRSAYFDLQKRVILKAAQIIGIEVPEEDLPEEWRGELFIIEKYLTLDKTRTKSGLKG